MTYILFGPDLGDVQVRTDQWSYGSAEKIFVFTPAVMNRNILVLYHGKWVIVEQRDLQNPINVESYLSEQYFEAEFESFTAMVGYVKGGLTALTALASGGV